MDDMDVRVKPLDRYLSPVSGRRTTIVLPAFSGRFASCMAAHAAAPDEITGEKPNKKRRRRHKPRRKNKGDADRPEKNDGENKAGE